MDQAANPALRQRIQASLENLVFALGEAAGAERSSLFVVDADRAELRLAVARPEQTRRLDGYPTRSVLCIPVRGASGRVAGLLELLAADGFTPEAEREAREHECELGALLDACGALLNASGALN
jgi:hypothetical protein